MEVIPQKTLDLGLNDDAKQVKQFVETNGGVKALADSGAAKIPKIFIHQPESLPTSKPTNVGSCDLQVPVVDLQGLETGRRGKIVSEISRAAETWGVFRMVNHGVPDRVMDGVLDAMRQFHEQTHELKMEYCSSDPNSKVRFNPSGTVNETKPGSWRDLLICNLEDQQLGEKALPPVCREAVMEYVKCVIKVKDKLCELMSEALGLRSDYIGSIECMNAVSIVGNYYPVCPEPDLTLGLGLHSDPGSLTINLQDSNGGLQVLHQNQWIDVPHVHGSLIANIGDFIQIITNDKFKSVVHRVLARSAGTRVSAPCFFTPSAAKKKEAYKPAEELVSEKNPPIYRETCFTEYLDFYRSRGPHRTSGLIHFKLSSA